MRGIDVTAIAIGRFKWHGCVAVGEAVVVCTPYNADRLLVYNHAAGTVHGVDVSMEQYPYPYVSRQLTHVLVGSFWPRLTS